MSTVTVSPKFQIVIPKLLREALEIQPGHKLHALRYGKRIELIPVRPLVEARGFLKGIDTTIEREPDRM
jgi:AbrB family looped-hinge helix DNA binding protein